MNSFLRKLALAGTPDAAPRSGPSGGANLASAIRRHRRWRPSARLTASLGVWILALVGPLTGQNSPAQQPFMHSPGGLPCTDGPACAPGLSGCLEGLAPPAPFAFGSFYADYRFRRFREAHTSYEFGDPDPAGPNPLSRLEFPISSTWNGLELGLEAPWYAVRAEWLTPWSDRIDGRLEDRDWLWQFAGLPPSEDFSDLGVAEQRWIDGQMVDLSLEIQLADSQRGLPISLWPVAGFRWQKFDIMAFDLKQLKGFESPGGFIWPLEPPFFEGDAIRFRQEYYQYYAGGQLHVDLPPGALFPGARLTFQGDWAHVRAFNFDHHLLREGIFITKENTQGNAWHVGVTAEIFLTDCFTVGVEGEYTQIHTSGSHHFINQPLGIDQTWTRGVHVWSDQTAITIFLRLRR